MGLLSSIGGVIGGFTGMPWMSGIGAGLDSILDRNASERGQQQANEFNAQQAQMNRDFQERMRATQYQTAVEDMKKAGLNPMLAYTQGGAGTPSGATSAPALNKVGAGISSAQQGAQTTQALQMLEMNKAQIDQVKATTDKIVSETMERQLNTAKLIADTDVSEQRAEEVSRSAALKKQQQLTEKYETEKKSSEAASAKELARQNVDNGGFAADVQRRKAEAKLSELEIPKSQAESRFYDDLGKANPYLKQIIMIIQALTGGMRIAR